MIGKCEREEGKNEDGNERREVEGAVADTSEIFWSKIGGKENPKRGGSTFVERNIPIL